jgi:hypothetical protein
VVLKRLLLLREYEGEVMTAVGKDGSSAFTRNAGGWFGSQLGGTLWLLVLGVVVMPNDRLAASVCIGGCAALNAWGLYLWRSRERLRAYTGIQRFLAVASLIVALVVLVLNYRGVSGPPTPGAPVSTHVPYWSIVVVPTLMLLFAFQERGRRRNRN